MLLIIMWTVCKNDKQLNEIEIYCKPIIIYIYIYVDYRWAYFILYIDVIKKYNLIDVTCIQWK